MKTLLSLFLCLLFFAACSKEVKPFADFTWSASSTTAPSTVTFTNASRNATEYNWDFGDGNKSTAKDPTHRYTTRGSYLVNLTVKNGLNQFNTVTKTIALQ